ncbi:MAG: mucoidy inhibitor MuiA family protein [Deltaproteobacteria bacterium]|nr:mucoidy inhibitor MuiA family protein [Deltaproteobacteria bacterium]
MRIFRLILVATLAAPSLAHAAEPEAVPSKIRSVTVFADRAEVSRIATIEARAEASRVAVTRLPGWIDVESLRVAVDPPGAAQILDVSAQAAFAAESPEEAVRTAKQALAQVADELAELGDEERTLLDEIARLEALRAIAVDKLPRELAVGEVKVKNLSDAMAFVTEAVRNDRKALRSLAKRKRELQPVLEQRQAELAEVQVRAQLQTSTVVVELRRIDGGSGKLQLRLTYLTPGASWEPTGELRVSKDASKVEVLQYANVVQTTGEDWSGATLNFSTQRQGDMLDVPQAHGLMLDRGGAGLNDVIGRMTESFSRAQTVYSQQNEAMAKNRRHWDDSLAHQRNVQQRAIESFSRLTQRGTTAHFAALAERQVRSDGKPVRVPIAAGEFPAKSKIIAVPEVSLNAVRVAEVVNQGKAPILPGHVALFSDGAFIGSSQVDFAAVGEAFSVFLGVHDRVKLERALDKKLSSLHRGGRRTQMKLAFAVTAENLSDQPVTIELSERIPVAQTEEIEVDDVETPRKVKPDGQGVVRWTETLPPRSKSIFRISYTLDYPSDYAHRSPRQPRGYEPSPAKRSMPEQIDMLEKSF